MVTLHVSRRAAADRKLALRNSANYARYTYRANLFDRCVPETQQKLRHADIAMTINMVETRSECNQLAVEMMMEGQDDATEAQAYT